MERKYLKILGLLTFFIILYQNCSQEKVNLSLISSFNSNDNFCIVAPLQVDGKPTKILFIVDVSGSNSINDPQGRRGRLYQSVYYRS